MAIVQEIDLEFDFSTAISAVKIDETLFSSADIKSADFFVKYSDHIKIIEVKDPDVPGASNPQGILDKMHNGKLSSSLAGKIRDTIFILKSQGENFEEIEYITLLSMASLQPPQLLALQNELRRKIPLNNSSFPNDSLSRCVILNLRQWERKFPDSPITRISSKGIS